MDIRYSLVYEQGPCSRGGGSGHYSYCQLHGTTCFKCKGQQQALTKAGAKAVLAVRAFIAAHYSVPVEALVAGDRISIDGVKRTVASVATSGSRYGVGRDAAGEPLAWHHYIEVTFTTPVPSQFGAYSAMNYCQGQTVVKAVKGADWDAVVAFARTLKKGVTIVEAAR